MDEPEPEEQPEQRAGELQIGNWGYQVLWERARKLPPRKVPFGFRAGVSGEDQVSADQH